MEKNSSSRRYIFITLAILVIVEILLFAANYKAGTWLLGWDNVVPELNFGLNLKRNLFAVWQEYRGLGLVDGMSHGANLPHTLFLFFMSLVLPKNVLRYAFTFISHLAGGVGMFLLLNHFYRQRNKNQHLLIALVGALFYTLNLYTIQMFYTPLEAFSVHFATLPWLAFSLMSYLSKGNKKQLLVFIVVALLTLPQFFVTTLFLPVSALFTAVCSMYLLLPSGQESFKMKIRRVLTSGTLYFLINAFWLLPYLYSLPNNGPIIAGAKINQMSSQEIFLRNQAFGDLKNIFLLRGFSLDFLDFQDNGSNGFMMQAWRDHLYQSLPTFTSGSLSLVSIFGMVMFGFVFIKLIMKRKLSDHSDNLFLPGTALLTFIFALFFLGNNIVGIRELNNTIRSYFPVFGEAFRFTFTKFSLLFAFSLSVFLSLVVSAASRTLKKIHYLFSIFPAFLCLIAIIYVAWPAFNGFFLYQNLRVQLPNEYLEMMEYLNYQKQAGRITLLPQYDYWSWKHYRFGYRGSGFLWYGIAQPMMDRAFDPWSRNNENYYWELSLALYSKNIQLLTQVLQKYHIQYILVDKYLRPTSNVRQLLGNDIEYFLATSSKFRLIKSLGQLSLYENRSNNVSDFVILDDKVKEVYPPYRSSDQDLAYQEFNNYISTSNLDTATIVYPFRTLLTKRSVDERDFSVQDSLDKISISKMIEQPLIDWQAVEASPSSNLNITENNVTYVIEKNEALINDLNSSNFLQTKYITTCGANPDGHTSAEMINDQDQSWLRFSSYHQRSCLSFGLGDLPHREGYLVEVESKNISGTPLRFAIINATAGHTETETFLPVKSDWNTTYFILPPLAQDGIGYDTYIINDSVGYFTSSNDIKSIRVFRFPYNNLISLKFVNPNYTPADYELQTTNFELASVSHPNPAEYLVTLKYSDLSPHSSDQQKTRLTADSLTDVHASAYRPDLSGNRVTNDTLIVKGVDPRGVAPLQSDSRDPTPHWREPTPQLAYQESGLTSTAHAAENSFTNNEVIKQSNNVTLILYQSFHSGWLAFDATCQGSSIRCQLMKVFPYLLGKRLTNHILVNNWANGWLLEPTTYNSQLTTIYIVFWPQILEFVGFALLPLPFLFILRRNKGSN